jgi:hypothetical protein
VNRKTLIYLLLVFAVAATVRLVALNRIPYGVFIDEGMNGVEGIQAVRTGHFHLYYPANTTEGFFVTLIGFSESLFGVNQFGLRLVSALAGTLTVLVTFFFTRRIYSDRVALLVAWFMATGFWHLLFSRMAVNAVLFVPLLLALSLFLLGVALDRSEGPPTQRAPAWVWAVLAGAAYGLGFYTYLPFRATPLLMAFVVLLEIQRLRRENRPLLPALRTFAVFGAATMVAAAPMALYFLRRPADFTSRMAQVSITREEYPVLVQMENIERTAGMFNFHGDENWRHNFAGSPELLAPVGIFFLVGLWMTTAEAWRKKWRATHPWMLLAWFLIMLLPELLTSEGVPHSMRAFGVIVPVYVFAGLGADQALALGGRKRMFVIAILGVVIGSGVYEGWRYFHDWARHGAHLGMQTFSQQQADESVFLNSLPASTPRFVISQEAPTAPYHKDPGLPLEVDYHMPMRAQTVAFGTMDHVHPVFMDIAEAVKRDPATFPSGSVIVALEGRAETLGALQAHGLNLDVRKTPSFVYGIVR